MMLCNATKWALMMKKLKPFKRARGTVTGLVALCPVQARASPM